jgi:uncharacterized protein YjdB
MLNRGGVILTLLLLALVSGSVWGQEVVHVFTKYDKQVITDDQKGTWKTSVASTTSNELPADFSATSAKSRGVAFGANAEVTSDFVVENISELIIEASSNERGNSLSVKVGDVELSPKTSTLPKVNHETYSFKSSEPLSGQITISIRRSKKTVWIGGVTIKSSGSANQVRMPVFTPVTGSLFKDKLTVTASCPTEGATVYYTTDGTVPTVGSKVFPTEGVTLTETTTLKAIAVKDGLDNSEVVTATYTKLEPYASLKALKESGIATTEGVTCFVELKDAVVTYADSRKAYIQDETAGLYVFGSNNLKAGTKLDGLVSAQLALYFGLYELKVDGGEFDNVAVTNDVEIPVQEVTVAELNQNFARYESMRVKVVDATVTSSFNDKNGEIEQNGEKIALRAADENITADVQATVDVTGYPGLYNSTKQLNVILQEDIAVKTAGKTQATLTFDSDAYSMNVGESLTVKATTNSSASVVYSSSDETIATVDENTGEVQAGNKAGTVTITATVTENDEYTGATATCTVNVVDPSALPEAKALVAEKDGVYYAMLNTTDKSKLNASVATVLNGKVITDRSDLCGWYVDEENGTIQSISNNQYVAHGSGNTDLELQSNSFKWDCRGGMWQCEVSGSERAIGYNSSTDKFGTYLVSDDTYPKAVVMPITEGYHRNVTSGDYGTICLPYAVAAEDMAGAEFFSIAGKVMKGEEPQSIVLNQVTTLEAGVPYIFSATSDKLIAAYSGKAVAVAEEANGLIGSFEGQDVAEGMYLISAQNKVQLCGKSCKISGNRAYIDMNEVPEYSGEVGVNQRLISFEDATGISETMVEGGLADVYTLSGVEVRHQVDESEATQGLPQGIYIVNGKKVVVK